MLNCKDKNAARSFTDANSHYETGKEATIYRFTSDQFYSFLLHKDYSYYLKRCHSCFGWFIAQINRFKHRRALYRHSRLQPNFGLIHPLGFKFAPRIRDLSDSKLFTIDKESEYPKLEAILRGQINTKVIKENYEDFLRLAHIQDKIA